MLKTKILLYQLIIINTSRIKLVRSVKYNYFHVDFTRQEVSEDINEIFKNKMRNFKFVCRYIMKQNIETKKLQKFLSKTYTMPA